MIRMLCTLILLAAPLAVVAKSAPYEPTGTLVTVGSDAACQYSSLAAATIANTSISNIYIRVAKNIAPQQGVLFGRAMTIEGGYDTCSDNTASGRTDLEGTGTAGSVFYLARAYSGSTSYDVVLRNLKISGGVGASSPARGGGLTIAGPLRVFLDNTLISSNSAPEDGGGVLIEGQPGDAGDNELTQLVLYGNSKIQFNNAKRGGGIACKEKVNVQISDASVNNNEVTEVGGGVYNLGCYMRVFGNAPGIADGIFFNEANGSLTGGGGIYVDSGSVFLHGGLKGPAKLYSNTADLGAGIYLRSYAKLYAFDARINSNTAIAGGGAYAENSTIVIARTLAGAGCHDELRCSTLSDNWATGTSSSTGGGALYVDGGTTRISGTFMEQNRAFNGHGMAVRAVSAVGTNSGLDQNGLRILGSVVAENTDDGGAIDGYESVVEMKDSSGVIGFTTFARNGPAANVIYTPATGTFHAIDVYGSIFDASTGNVAGPGTSGPVPNGDCNRLHETTSLFSSNSARSTTSNPGFVDAPNDDYRLGGLNLVDWCDASFNFMSTALSADGSIRPYDDPGIGPQYGDYDLGGLEKHPSDLIFRNGFQDF